MLNIHDLDTEQNDILSVYDQVEFNPSYGRIPISNSALAHFSKSLGSKANALTSKRNQVFLQFKSNEKKSGKGFAINYHTKDFGEIFHFNSKVILKLNVFVIKFIL